MMYLVEASVVDEMLVELIDRSGELLSAILAGSNVLRVFYRMEGMIITLQEEIRGSEVHDPASLQQHPVT